jgi:hypothetical protein
MSAVAFQYEYLIKRAKKEKNDKLADQLAKAYEKYLDEATR